MRKYLIGEAVLEIRVKKRNHEYLGSGLSNRKNNVTYAPQRYTLNSVNNYEFAVQIFSHFLWKKNFATEILFLLLTLGNLYGSDSDEK